MRDREQHHRRVQHLAAVQLDPGEVVAAADEADDVALEQLDVVLRQIGPAPLVAPEADAVGHDRDRGRPVLQRGGEADQVRVPPEGDHVPVARFVAVAGRAVEDRRAVVLVEAADVREGVLHAAREHDAVRKQVVVHLEQAVVPERGPGCGPVPHLDGRVGQDLLAALGEQLERHLRIAAEVAVGPVHLRRAVLLGVEHDDRAPVAAEPGRGGQPGRPAADHDDVYLEPAHARSSRPRAATASSDRVR